MYKTLLHHTWLGFRRSHHFERSLGTLLILVFVGFTLMLYMLGLGMMLPSFLNHYFPDQAVIDSFLSLLVFIYAGDFTVRFFMQKVPVQQVQPYLHLPVKRGILPRIIMARSWLSIYNFYLFALLFPFFYRTLMLTGNLQAFWLLLAGCFLLGSVNHTLILLLKTRQNKSIHLTIVIIALAAGLSVGIFFFRDYLFAASKLIGQGLMHGNPWVFLVTATIVAALHLLTTQGLQRSLYRLHDHTGASKTAATGRIEAFFQRIPFYGNYWLLEWRLLNRNKRATRGFRQWPLSIVFVIFFVFYGREDLLHTYMVFFLMFAGSYGFFHLQYVYSWESRFFDYIASKKIDLYEMIRSKYYFYVGIAILQTIIMAPILYFIRPEVVLPLIALMLYVTGPVFILLFYWGIGYSTRIDPDKKAFFNTEGTSGTQFVLIIMIMLSYIPFTIIAFMLPFGFETALSITLGIAGLTGIATHRFWLARVAKRFKQRKYVQLAKYREK